ncbi:MAG: glycosyltransferase family 2 protein [Synergistaceae bacterium]|nr:glycosyltransferase family 2 protein [Synergistaceae bacterium]
MQDTLFSVIMLAYNCEKYITKCLDSYCSQDYPAKNFEILITDDGSTDKTGEICDSYAEKFPFVKVFHTKNQGTSAARNVALPHCQGKYITFCDSDDFVSPQLISILTHAVEIDPDSDMFVFNYCTELNNNQWPLYDISGMKISDWENISSENLSLEILKGTKIGGVGGFTWNKVFKRELVQKILFDANLSVMDDQYWVIKVLSTYPDMKICKINYCLYCYVQHPNFGQSRIPGRIYNKDGLSWFVVCQCEELALNLTPKVREQIEGLIYYWSTGNLYQMGKLMTPETRKYIKSLMRKYAAKYYFRSKHSLSLKLRALFRHLLALLHVHKYK